MRALPATCPVRALGLEFPGPIGLAAGYDREARHVDDVLGWGFGFVELGTVTPRPQPDHNPGAAALVANLARSRVFERAIGARPVIGVNLGVQPGSPPKKAWCDFACSMHALWRHADYLVLNLTSSVAQPLHAPEWRSTLLGLLVRTQEERQRLVAETGRRVPLLVKWPVGPALSDGVEVAQRLRRLGYDGLVAAFDAGPCAVVQWESWVPQACRRIVEAIGPHMTLIAVGGIDCATRALAIQRAGARLVQLYRGFEAAGPGLVRRLARAWAQQTAAQH